MQSVLRDNHNRIINYLRLAVTDRCNLRCFYCMPEHGIDWLQRTHLLSVHEMVRLCSILAAQGVSKVRITGGEPFVRKDIMSLLSQIAAIQGITGKILRGHDAGFAPTIGESICKCEILTSPGVGLRRPDSAFEDARRA